MHLTNDQKLVRIPFSESKSDHNCVQEKPKLDRRQPPGEGPLYAFSAGYFDAFWWAWRWLESRVGVPSLQNDANYVDFDPVSREEHWFEWMENCGVLSSTAFSPSFFFDRQSTVLMGVSPRAVGSTTSSIATPTPDIFPTSELPSSFWPGADLIWTFWSISLVSTATPYSFNYNCRTKLDLL